ncbi:MAG: class I SAM-dependent methyltransferase [Saprospiraceae bacterium]|nr:class I SAM-dependent methyltransferase [Saprospiraceae bacterium]
MLVKSILISIGFDFVRYDKIKILFIKLFNKYASHTMIPEKIYVDNLELINGFLKKNIAGDVVECGVWRGGMIAGIASISGKERKYFLFDSFEGLPKANEIDGKAAMDWQKDVNSKIYYDNCTAEQSYAIELMTSLNVNFEIHKGWFDKTLVNLPPSTNIAILRLDADWYDSTMVCLKELYNKVVQNGLIIIDDYYVWDGCSRAVHDFLASINSISRIYCFNNSISYIIKKD